MMVYNTDGKDFFFLNKFIRPLFSLRIESWIIVVSQWDQSKMVPESHLSLMRTFKKQDYLFSDTHFWDMNKSVNYFLRPSSIH